MEVLSKCYSAFPGKYGWCGTIGTLLRGGPREVKKFTLIKNHSYKKYQTELFVDKNIFVSNNLKV